jgi:hypothetical protein
MASSHRGAVARPPEPYGPVGTVSSRFYRWRQAGIWQRVLAALQTEADARGEVDWRLHLVDATIVRAPQHAAGARRTGALGGRGCGALARRVLDQDPSARGRQRQSHHRRCHPRSPRSQRLPHRAVGREHEEKEGSGIRRRLTDRKDAINHQPDPTKRRQGVAGFKSEPRPASRRNRWPASDWNAWPASSEAAPGTVVQHKLADFREIAWAQP